MEKRYIIYRLHFPNSKSYIGQTNNYRRRMREHESGAAKGCIRVHRAILHYSWDNVRKIKPESNIPTERVDELEKFYICTLGTMHPNGYNLTDGGQGSHIVLAETREKLGKGRLGKKHTTEARTKSERRRIVLTPACGCAMIFILNQ